MPCGTFVVLGDSQHSSKLWYIRLDSISSNMGFERLKTPGSFAGRAYSLSLGTGSCSLRLWFWLKNSISSDLLCAITAYSCCWDLEMSSFIVVSSCFDFHSLFVTAF